MWRDVLVKINGRIIQGNTDTYDTEQFLLQTVSNSAERKEYTLKAFEGYLPDKPEQNYVWSANENPNLMIRKSQCQSGTITTSIIKLPLLSSDSGRDLLNGMEFTIELTHNTDDRRYKRKDTETKVPLFQIMDIELHVQFVMLRAEIYAGIQRELSMGRPVCYPCRRPVTFLAEIPKGATRFSCIPFREAVPDICLVTMVPMQTYIGALANDTYLYTCRTKKQTATGFDYSSVKQISMKFQNTQIPDPSFMPDLIDTQKLEFLREFASLLDCCGSWATRDYDIGMSNDRWLSQFTV